MMKWIPWTMVLFLGQAASAGPMEDYCDKASAKRYETRETCVQAEKDAREEVAALKADSALLEYCQNIVGESWVLVRLCLKKEMELKKLAK